MGQVCIASARDSACAPYPFTFTAKVRRAAPHPTAHRVRSSTHGYPSRGIVVCCMIIVVAGRSSGASRPASASSRTRHPRTPAPPPRACVSTAVACWAAYRDSCFQRVCGTASAVSGSPGALGAPREYLASTLIVSRDSNAHAFACSIRIEYPQVLGCEYP